MASGSTIPRWVPHQFHCTDTHPPSSSWVQLMSPKFISPQDSAILRYKRYSIRKP